MDIIVVLLPLALLLAGFFIVAFVWSTRKGQYDDLETPRFRMLLEDKKIKAINIKILKDRK
jgi:cbb3-type cytochrome oxidase maturation protein